MNQIHKTSIYPSNTDATTQQMEENGCSLATYADLKKLDSISLTQHGVKETKQFGVPALAIPYRDEHGSEVATRIRTSLTGKNKFLWKKGSKPILYGLWQLAAFKQHDFIFLCEGESDCHTLWYHDYAALGVPGASMWNDKRDAPHLAHFDTIFFIMEEDSGGETLLKALLKSSLRDRISIVRLGSYKDASALHVADPLAFAIRLSEAMEKAEPLAAYQQNISAQQSIKYQQGCKEIAESKDILALFYNTLTQTGFIGSVTEAKILFLALTSRMFERPISVVVKGQSSSGKSYLVERTLLFFPHEAHHAVTALSNKAIVYMTASLKHRFLIVYEASGVFGEDGSYMLRSLLSENHLVYEMVEKTAKGMVPRKIEKEGPTGLIITTTAAHLHPENETRMLALTTVDTKEQTRGILACNAARVASGEKKAEVNFTPWHDFQHWLFHSQSKVVIPFAGILAEMVDASSIRIRRDFTHILTMIQTHALIHQHHRKRDEYNRIVATVEDYAVVRQLIAQILSHQHESAVPSNVRETVEAVRELLLSGKESVSITELAHHMHMHKSTLGTRVKNAIAMGYLENLETRARKIAKVVLASPMPQDKEILPCSETVAELYGA